MAIANYEDIVANSAGPTLVLAGPGSGKTYLLADRVKRLLDDGTDRRQITVLTFGRDASQHMRNKLLDPKNGFGITSNNLPNISTMHALGFEIINKKPGAVGLRKSDLQVQDDETVRRLLYRDASLILGHAEKQGREALDCKQIGDCKIDSRQIECEICKKYWEIMAKCNRIDFDDQILFACLILDRYPDILSEYQTRSRYLLVDEYQDINAAQFRLIEMLSRVSRQGLFAVGDDAQSIYGFRGANPQFILNFQNDYAEGVTRTLAHSRRCHENTMKDAIKVLSKYYQNWTGPGNLEYHVEIGDVPKIWQLPTDKAEAEWAARIAREAVGAKKNVLILVPKKEFFPALSRAFKKFKVPHQCPLNLLDSNHNKRLDVLECLLKWVMKPNDNFLTRLAIEEILDYGVAKVPGANKGSRCKPETIANRVRVEKEIALLWESVNAKRSLWSIVASSNSQSKSLQSIKKALVALHDSYDQDKQIDRGSFAKQLVSVSGVWGVPERFSEDFLALVNLVKGPQPTGFGSVQMLTMKKAKGLEADVVVIVGLEDDIIPGKSHLIEEEARLFYVSMTRAIEKLYLLHSYKRPRNISLGPEIIGKKRSRFLDALERPSKYLRRSIKTN